MPYKIVGTPTRLRDIATSNITLSFVKDLQYVQGKVFAVRGYTSESDASIEEVYDPSVSTTRLLRSPNGKAGVNISVLDANYTLMTGGALTIIGDIEDADNTATFRILTELYNFRTTITDVLRAAGRFSAQIGSAITGYTSVPFTGSSANVGNSGWVVRESNHSLPDFVITPSVPSGVPSPGSIAINKNISPAVFHRLSDETWTSADESYIRNVGGTAVINKFSRTEGLNRIIAAAFVAELQHVIDSATISSYNTIPVVKGSTSEPLVRAVRTRSSWDAPRNTVSGAQNTQGAGWYRAIYGIKTPSERGTRYRPFFDIMERRAARYVRISDGFRNGTVVSDLGRVPTQSDVNTEIRFLEVDCGNYLLRWSETLGTHIYSVTSTGDTLVRSIDVNAVSLTSHRGDYIAINGTQLQELALGGHGSDDVIVDFATQYRSLNSARGVSFTGAPAICSDDERYIYFVGTDVDSSGDIEKSLWRVQITDLEIPNVSNASYNTGQHVLLQLPEVITGTGTGPYTYSLSGALPFGLSYNGTARTITGTVARRNMAADFFLTYQVRDSYGATDVQRFRIIINTQPYLPEIETIRYPVNERTLQLAFPVVQNKPDDVTYRYLLSFRPSVMPAPTVSSALNRLLIRPWTPTTVRRYLMVLSAFPTPRGDLPTLRQTFTMEIFQPNRAPVFGNIPVINGTLGREINPDREQFFTVTDPDGDDIHFSKFGGPAWVSVGERTGLITGIATVPGTQTMQYIATDQSEEMLRSMATVTFNIANVTSGPLLPDIPTQNWLINRSITPVRIPDVINSPGNTYDYSVLDLPAGIRLDAGTRQLVGTPTTAGRYTIRYRATRTAGTLGPAIIQNSFTANVIDNRLNQPDLEYQAGTLVPARVSLARVTDASEGVTYEYTYSGLPDQIVYFSGAHVLTRAETGIRWPSEGTHTVLIEATPSDDSSIVRDSFTITITPGSDGTLTQNDLQFVQNRNVSTVAFARVQNGPAGAVYRYTIGGTAPTGMTLTPNGIGGTPTTVQRVDLTLHARATSAGADDPNSPYATEFSVTIVPDPTISGITLGCRNKTPIGTDSQGRPIYEYFVGEKPRLFWEARNLNLRDNNSYRVGVSGGVRRVVSDEDGTHVSIGNGYIGHTSELFNNLVPNFRQATNPFKDLTYFEPLGTKTTRVNSFSVYGPGTIRKTFTGRFFHSAGSRVFEVVYYDNQLRDIESRLTTGLAHTNTEGRATTPTAPAEYVYTATLDHVPGAPDYSGVTFVTRSTDADGDIIPPGRITGLYQARRGGTDLPPDPPKSHSIRIRWIPHPLEWADENGELEFNVFGGESYATQIGTLGGASGGTPPYKYSLHGTLLPGMVTEPYMRLDTQIDKSVRRDYLEAEEQATPPRIFGTAPNNNLGYAGLYEMCVDSSPTPQVIWRLVKINLYPSPV